MADIKQEVRFVADVDFDRRDAKSGLIAVVSIVTILVLAVFVIGVSWFYTVTLEQVEQAQFTGVASKELIAIREREDEQLHKYGYINKERGIVRLPVERAMQLVEEEAKAGKAGWNTKAYPAQIELPGGAAAMSWKPDGTGTAAHVPVVPPSGAPATKNAIAQKQ
jgi:hypothetical protein